MNEGKNTGVEKTVRVGRIYIRLSPQGTFVKAGSGIDRGKLKSILSHMKIPTDERLIESILKSQDRWIMVSPHPIQKDGHYIFQTSPDGLIGRITYYPALVGRDLTADEIYTLLINKDGVRKQFIVKDGIQRALSMPGTPQVVAHGIPPIHGRSASIKVVPEGKKKHVASGKIDWRELGSLIFVNEGDIILQKEPPTPGKPGTDIFGKEIPPIPGRDIELSALVCDNIAVAGNMAIAKSSGILTQKDGKYCIEEVFVVDGDLDYEIGNIHNVKHVEIRGSVLPGFSVEAKGHVIVRGAVENGYITAGGNVFVEGIITGDKEGYIKAGGFVYGKEIIEARVEAGDSVYAGGGFRHSNVMAGKHIIVIHPKGVAVGGALRARKYIYVAQAGNIHGTKTLLHAGCVDDLLADIESLKKDIEELRSQIGELIKEAHLIKKKAKLKDIERKIEELKKALDEKREKKKTLEEMVRQSSSFAIYIGREAHPGTTFRLGRGYVYRPQEKIGACIVRVVDGKLGPDKWKKPPFSIKMPKVKIK